MRRHWRSLIGMLFVMTLVACGSDVEAPPTPTAVAEAPTATAEPQPPNTATCTTPVDLQTNPADLRWWNDAVFYEIFVRSFFDSDGDGIGDFNGLLEKLDYLNDGDPNTDADLGITGIWLMPINASPSYHGYDVIDYYAVNPEYGTMEEFQALLDAAHERGIRIIVDLVLNHTSTQHPWFQEANADPDSPYRDYYIFEDSPPGFKSPWGTDVWHRGLNGAYYGVFWEGMPDLNFTNPDVTADMQDVIRFWLEDVGVDGFRLDAIKHLIENGSVQENTPATHAWWEGFYDYYTAINPDALTVGEAWTSTEEVLDYIGDEVNIAFEFDLAGAMLQSARRESSFLIASKYEQVTEDYPPHQYATFLTNHDQDRVMSHLLGREGRAKTAAALLLTGPGVPFIYYGEEIGHRGRKPDEDIRTPMQWSAAPNAGFTTAQFAWRGPQGDFDEVNVAAQVDDPDSLLNHYRSLIHARNENEALRYGDWQEMPVDESPLYAFLRRTADQMLLVLINMSDEPITDYAFCLQEGGLSAGTAVELLHGTATAAPALDASGGFDGYTPIAELAPYTTYIVDLE